MCAAEWPRNRDSAYASAYYRILGQDSGKALKPLLMSLGESAPGSEWDRVRAGLAAMNPWLARVVEEMANRGGSSDVSRAPRDGHAEANTSQHN